MDINVSLQMSQTEAARTSDYHQGAPGLLKTGSFMEHWFRESEQLEGRGCESAGAVMNAALIMCKYQMLLIVSENAHQGCSNDLCH